jgi:hypothetical protein
MSSEGGIARPTASTINDDQLDAVFEGLDLLEEIHRPTELGTCFTCGRFSPCETEQIIVSTRQRIRNRGDSDGSP